MRNSRRRKEVRLADLVFLRRLLVAKLAVQIKSLTEPEDSSSLYKKSH